MVKSLGNTKEAIGKGNVPLIHSLANDYRNTSQIILFNIFQLSMASGVT